MCTCSVPYLGRSETGGGAAAVSAGRVRELREQLEAEEEAKRKALERQREQAERAQAEAKARLRVRKEAERAAKKASTSRMMRSNGRVL